jgi:hypothetical protein
MMVFAEVFKAYMRWSMRVKDAGSTARVQSLFQDKQNN